MVFVSIDNSDYNKKRLNLFSLLPDVYQSNVNESIFENLFNRYLTKTEVEQVNGYIGEGNKDALFRRRIHEPTINRQAFQLQPIVYNKIGTVEWMMSWRDIQIQAQNAGINIDSFDKWGEQQHFNWVPPVDIDKIINYKDYYWVDNEQTNPTPEYITIRNRCVASIARLKLYQDLILQYRDTFPIIEKQGTNSIIISGNFSELFKNGFVFFIKNSSNNTINNTFFISNSSTYNVIDNKTIIVINDINIVGNVDGVISLQEEASALISQRDCLCSGGLGWDEFLWDDSPSTPSLWFDSSDGSDFYTLIANLKLGNVSPTQDSLWFDESTDTLKGYVDSTWKTIYVNFSYLLYSVTGNAAWEFSGSCDVELNAAALQWSNSNKWMHKSLINNFSGTKQAKFPIIEYDYDLELNEWTHTTYSWKYRKTSYDKWELSTKQPELNELVPIDDFVLDNSTHTITIAEKYGNLTEYFKSLEYLSFYGVTSLYSIETVRYEKTLTSLNTIITLTAEVTDSDYVSPNINYIKPLKTANGDSWVDYNDHWLFNGVDKNAPINHQSTSPFAENYNESFYVTQPSQDLFLLTDSSLKRKSLLGMDDVRVYIDNVRQYGNYDEQYETDFIDSIDYVVGIKFLPSYEAKEFETVRIEVGESCLFDMYRNNISVRTIESDFDFSLQGTTNVSLIQYRKYEQVKSVLNQYPLFDLYNIFGESLSIANNIFGYKESNDVSLVSAIGKRIVFDKNSNNFYFEQQLLNENTKELYAYRDYSNKSKTIWYNYETKTFKFWDQYNWHDMIFNEGYPVIGVSSIDEPSSPLKYMYWYDELHDIVKQYDGNVWETVTGVYISNMDDSLQTIWKSFPTNNTYKPQRVDWENRTKQEYYTEKQNYIQSNYISYLLQADGNVTEANQIGEDAWIEKESKYFNVNWLTDDIETDGEWAGDWEIPDYLYYNPSHDNRKEIETRELLKHFNTIMQNQPPIYGYTNTKNMFPMLESNQVNYSLGGTIKEHNGGFDSYVSSIFVNNSTPVDIIHFANSQYEILLNSSLEAFRLNATSLLLDVNINNILFMNEYITTSLKSLHETNDVYSILYGDSSVYDEKTQQGVRNWIATLPYIKMNRGYKPVILLDEKIGVEELKHHDGHIRDYNISDANLEILKFNLVKNIDPRTKNTNLVDTIGRNSTQLPPNTILEFENNFITSIDNRSGVYWLYKQSNKTTLYRFTAIIGGLQPNIGYPNGTLWLDLTSNLEVLRIKTGSTWPVISGNTMGDGKLHNGTTIVDATISVWKEVNLKEYILESLLLLENDLYSNIPEFTSPAYSIENTYNNNTELFNTQSRNEYLNYANNLNIAFPFINSNYVNSDPFTWNYKRCVNGIRFEIIDSDDNYFLIYDPNNIAELELIPGQTFYVKNSGVNSGSWEVSIVSIFDTNTKKVEVTSQVDSGSTGVLYKAVLPSSNNNGSESASYWKALYNEFYNTPYPHLEPWKLQGYIDKPYWWDSEYKDTTNLRRWTSIMWDNILNGIIPPNREYPNGSMVEYTTPTYNYVSVNIGSTILSGGYEPDDLLPPFFDNSAVINPNIRSIFNNYNNDIILPANDYEFGDNGPIEWQWRQSSNYLYGQLVICFKIDPLNFFKSTFGYEYINVAGLEIEKRLRKVISHTDIVFHGDIIDGDILKFAGLNQWYVNYNRYSNYDIGISDFYASWKNWTTPLMYQFSSFIDVPTVDIAHKSIELTNYDYNITTKKSIGVEDYWLFSFKGTLIKIPPSIMRYDNQSEWEIQLNTAIVTDEEINYYDVKNYQCSADSDTNSFTLYDYEIDSIDSPSNKINIVGNHVYAFSNLSTFDIEGSVNNDGTYTVWYATYDAGLNITIIAIYEDIVSDNTGRIIANYRVLPWITGDKIYMSTDETLPAPFDVSKAYFIIKLSDNKFQLAFNRNEALDNIPMLFSSNGRGQHYIGSVAAFFTAEGASTRNSWRHYEIDYGNLLTLKMPYLMKGMQNLINFVDGYKSNIERIGWRINAQQNITDPSTGRVVNWQSELEYFINWSYAQQRNKQVVSVNNFNVEVDDYTTGVFRFIDSNVTFITGDEIRLNSVNHILPEPLLTGIRYYMIRDDMETFRLAATRHDAKIGVNIDITQLPNIVGLYITEYKVSLKHNLTEEINPFRTHIWFNPTHGIVSDISKGPVNDGKIQHLLFDQYGRKLSNSHLHIYRTDKSTHVAINETIENDVEIQSAFEVLRNPKHYLHIGGVHIFIDAYEHVIKFNDNTTDGYLIYDPFIGMNINKIEMMFNRQVDFTQRPNVGGFVVTSDSTNQLTLSKNIESSIEDLRYLHDTYKIDETHKFTKHARETLGYDRSNTYLDDLNVNNKTKFLFWKGQIQNKGSINSVKAFINSKRFIDAKLDEFWAVKIAEFGNAYEYKFPELLLDSDDGKGNDLRLEFLEPNQNGNPAFKSIYLNDNSRWHEAPEQVKVLKENNLSLYFDMSANKSRLLDDYTNYYNGIIYHDGKHMHGNIYNSIMRHNFNSDVMQITFNSHPEGTIYENVFTVDTIAGEIITIPYTFIPNTGSLKIYSNLNIANIDDSYGNELILGVDYNEVDGVTSNQLELLIPFSVNDKISIVFVTGTMKCKEFFPNERYHFCSINNNIIRFESELYGDLSNIKLWGMYSKTYATNPVKLIDNEAQVVIKTLQEWNPAQGIHYQMAINSIDIISDVDPAGYTNDPLTYVAQSAVNTKNTWDYNSRDIWGANKVNTIWLDNSELDYVPYCDKWVFPNINDRARMWGKPAEWVAVDTNRNHIAKVYKWIQSSYLPEEWNDIAIAQENDKTIDANIRANGRIYPKLFEKNSKGEWVIVKNQYNHYDVLLDMMPRPFGKYIIDTPYLTTDNILVYVNGILNNPTLVIKTTNRYITAIDVSPLNTGTPVSVIANDVLVLETTIPSYKTSTFTETVFSNTTGNAYIVDMSEFEIGEDVFIKVLDLPAVDMSDIQLPFPYTYTGAPITIKLPDNATLDDFDVIITVELVSGGVLNNISVPNTFNIDEFAYVVVKATDTVSDSYDIDYSSTIATVPANTIGYVPARIHTVDLSMYSLGDVIIISVNGENAIENSNGTILDIGGTEITGTYTVSLNDLYIQLPENSTSEPVDIIINTTMANINASVSSVMGYGSLINLYANSVEIFSGVSVPNIEIQLIPEVLFTLNGEFPLTINILLQPVETIEDIYPVIPNIVGLHGLGNYVELSNIKESDRVTLVKTLPSTEVIEEQIALGNMKYDYQYVTEQYYSDNNVLLTRYYFWVEDSNIAKENKIAPINIKYDLIKIPVPYLFYQNPNVEKRVNIDGIMKTLPYRYNQVFIRGLMGIISSDNRYVLRFTRDFSFREDLDKGKSSMDLKNNHEEWVMMRQEQPYHIDRYLWNKVIESMIGHKLSNPLIKVPSIERELYDIQYGSDTSYGLEADQMFIKGSVAIEDIKYYLFNKMDSNAIDMQYVLTNYNFDTTENIIELMNYIYESFPYYHVNAMFFQVLHDALTFKNKYKDIIKTSMIALHGIRVFEVADVFDD